MRLNTFMLGMVMTIMSVQALSWGKTGHRVTGAIAQQYLTSEAQGAISQLLPNESLAEASTYADEMRSDPSEFWQKTANPWHYVTVPKGKAYTALGAPVEGDAYTALKTFSAQLKDKNTGLEQKQLALRFIVHIIGDLHQPFHVGDGTDRGGNDIKLTFFGENFNLHSVWDSGLIDTQQLSYSEWTDWLSRKIPSQQAEKWMVADPAVWIAESVRLRASLYPNNNELSWDYQYQNMPVVKKRLQMGGVRIAAYLNALFK